MRKYKSIKVFIDYNHPLSILGSPIFLKHPRFKLYYQKTFLFGLIKIWVYRITLHVDPKGIFDVIESNYE